MKEKIEIEPRENKTIEIEGEFSELISNVHGIPGQNAEANAAQKEHNKWKVMGQKRQTKEKESKPYWNNVSQTNAL